MGSNYSLTQDEMAAYNAPFPSKDYKAGALVFPTLVPLWADMEGCQIGRDAMHFWKHHFRGPVFMAIGAKDKVIPPKAMKRLQRCCFPTCQPMMVPEAGHFVQEHGETIAQAALEYFDKVAAQTKPSARL